MIKKLHQPAIDDMLRAIDVIERLLAGRTFEDFSTDQQLKWAVERGIEIISEASRRLPANLRNKHPDIPWRRIAGIGNILRHEYQHVSGPIIYAAATQELARLRAALKAIEAHLDEPED